MPQWYVIVLVASLARLRKITPIYTYITIPIHHHNLLQTYPSSVFNRTIGLDLVDTCCGQNKKMISA